MSLLTTIITGVLGTFLTFSNGLADTIVVVFNLDVPKYPMELAEDIPTPPDNTIVLAEAPSAYEYGGALPDILIKNATYQKAAVIHGTPRNTETDDTIENSLVNIYCTYSTDTYIRTNTGTGFFVNYNGVILTNAHVAQFLLLEDLTGEGVTECIIRTGELATDAYEVALLYISPAWVQKHSELISDTNPKGTGERDYALLYVTETLDNSPLPSRFSYLQTNTDLLAISEKGASVTIGGYPAEKMRIEGVSYIPSLEIATTSIADLLTFGTSYADIMYLQSSAIGQQGVSGGPVVNGENQAIGLISTKGDQELLGIGSLNAITLSYIHRTILEETGFSFDDNVKGNLTYRAKLFKETLVPFLATMLAREL